MSNLRTIRQRMKSIASISKVTAATRLISKVSLRRYQHRFETAAAYEQNLHAILDVLSHSIEEKPLLLKQRDTDSKPAILAIFSDKGLCGSYNHWIASRTEYLLQHAKDPQLYILGHKGASLLQAYSSSLKLNKNIKETSDYGPIKEIAQSLVTDFYNGTINSCVVVYTHFHSILSTKPTEVTLFPIMQHPSKSSLLYGTDPEGSKILKATAEQYIAAQLYYLVQQSIVSENAVRMFAMENATQNAEDILASLHKAYHKTRQQNITQEILEIMGGAEAL